VLGPSSVGTPSSSRGGLRREAGREYEFTATNPQKQVLITTKLRTSARAMEKKGDYGDPECVLPPST